MNPILSALIRIVLSTLGLAVSFLPRPFELWLGPRLGRLYLVLDPRRRKIAYDNIRRCLPELKEAGWSRLLNENYRHYGILALEILHMLSPLPGHYRRYAQKVSRFEGLENWKRAHDKGKGVLFVSAHLANWELMAAAGALRGIPITMVTRHLKPEWLHKKMEAVRLSVNIRCAYPPRTMPLVLKGLRAGESIGFVLDQYAPPPMGIPVPFFGVKVDTLAAVGSLAQRTGAAIIPARQKRDASGLVHGIVEPELDLGQARSHPAQATEILARKVEDWIRANPSQWLWVHRRFKNVVWPLVSSALSLLLPLLSPAAAASFKGESCASCHAHIRDAAGSKEPKPAEFFGEYEAAIIGGGLSGLSAAYSLKDKKVVVLEKDDEPGGKTRRENFSRWSYASGAVYTSEPEGPILKMFSELGIYPLKFKSPVHIYWENGRLLEEWISEKGFSEVASDDAQRAQLKGLWARLKQIDAEGKLTIPIQESDPQALQEYDSISFWDYLLKNYGRFAAQIGDYYCRDIFGTGAKDYSAFFGLMYMASEIPDSYSWPGGLGEIAQALAKNLGGRIKTGAMVERVIASQDHVRVIFRRGDKRYEIKAQTAILAVPSFITRRITTGLSEKKQKALAAVRYSAYANVAMQFKKPVFEKAFVLWTPKLSFADITFPGGERLEGPPSKQVGQVAQASMPMGSGDGRRWLQSRSDEEIRKLVLADVEKVLPGAAAQIEDLNIIRWGHAMPIMGPGYLSKIQEELRRPEGRLFFAGVDTQGPAIEGAMFSGFQAAEQARRFLSQWKK
ncbi:MAG: hypothetical protein A3J74_05640 [Elusimicrobia bacterium RIFCSPHIGHO2_02_FULL_57_9]|nr:MAG: hypothetical protein A3J74_05640 [Elusimicrobia bacterium RIFCSPHIGHO2_02_FULL_57_9]